MVSSGRRDGYTPDRSLQSSPKGTARFLVAKGEPSYSRNDPLQRSFETKNQLDNPSTCNGFMD